MKLEVGIREPYVDGIRWTEVAVKNLDDNLRVVPMSLGGTFRGSWTGKK